MNNQMYKVLSLLKKESYVLYESNPWCQAYRKGQMEVLFIFGLCHNTVHFYYITINDEKMHHRIDEPAVLIFEKDTLLAVEFWENGVVIKTEEYY